MFIFINEPSPDNSLFTYYLALIYAGILSVLIFYKLLKYLLRYFSDFFDKDKANYQNFLACSKNIHSFTLAIGIIYILFIIPLPIFNHYINIRENKMNDTIQNIKIIFNNCDLQVNGIETVDYTGNQMHISSDNTSSKEEVINNSIYEKVDNKSPLINVNADYYNLDIYYDQNGSLDNNSDIVSVEKATYDIMGNTKKTALKISIALNNNGKPYIFLTFPNGCSYEYKLVHINGKPALKGNLNLGYGIEKAVFIAQ